MGYRPMRPAARMNDAPSAARGGRVALTMLIGAVYGGWLGLQHLTGWQYGVIAVATIALMVVG